MSGRSNRSKKPRVRAFKLDLFGRDDLILHTANLTRNRNGFDAMQDPSFRQQFYDRLNVLMAELEYQVVACVIRKGTHFERYGLDAIDPYMFSLNVLVERFCFELEAPSSTGLIVAKKRSPLLDRELDVAWLSLKIQGARFLSAKTIDERITRLVTRHKHDNIAGLQLADLVVTPIGRYVLGLLRLSGLDGPVGAIVEQHMESRPSTWRPDASLDQPLAYIHRRNVESVVITTSDGRLVGLLWRSDIDVKDE